MRSNNATGNIMAVITKFLAYLLSLNEDREREEVKYGFHLISSGRKANFISNIPFKRLGIV